VIADTVAVKAPDCERDAEPLTGVEALDDTPVFYLSP
jgi:hypothetical protein